MPRNKRVQQSHTTKQVNPELQQYYNSLVKLHSPSNDFIVRSFIYWLTYLDITKLKHSSFFEDLKAKFIQNLNTQLEFVLEGVLEPHGLQIIRFLHEDCHLPFETLLAIQPKLLIFACLTEQVEFVSYLLKIKNVSPNEICDNQKSALQLSINQGNLEIVQLLVEAGADTTYKEYYNLPALEYAVCKGRNDIARFLAKKTKTPLPSITHTIIEDKWKAKSIQTNDSNIYTEFLYGLYLNEFSLPFFTSLYQQFSVAPPLQFNHAISLHQLLCINSFSKS